MMGTLGAVLASKEIENTRDVYRAEVRGDIEDVDGVLKITRIHVNYFLKVEEAKEKAVYIMNSGPVEFSKSTLFHTFATCNSK